MAKTNPFFSRRNLFATGIAALLLASCHFSSEQPKGEKVKTVDRPVDGGIGHGKFTEVTLTHPLDQTMVTGGKNIYEVKCGSCHKLSEEKLVGPGWKGVTDRRRPEWIMNFVTNTEEMIDKDAQAQAMLEICMVRMPNQNLSDADARNVLEFMRSNDNKN